MSGIPIRPVILAESQPALKSEIIPKAHSSPKRTHEIIPKAHSLQSRVKIQIPGLGLPGHLDGSNGTVVVVPQYVVLIKLPPSDPYQRHGNYFAGQEPHSQENPTMSFGAIAQHSYSYWSSLPPPPPLLLSLNDFNTSNCDASSGCSYASGIMHTRLQLNARLLSRAIITARGRAHLVGRALDVLAIQVLEVVSCRAVSPGSNLSRAVLHHVLEL
jgi:hypothetical protein